MNACRNVCGPIFLSIPARRATRRTIRPALCRSIRCPSGRRKIGPSRRSPMAEVDRPGGARGERDGDDLAALAQHGQGAVPAFETELVDVGAERFGDPQPVDRQQRLISACSAAVPSPAATSSAPTSLRSNPTACDS